jgi:hypothetical protein
MHSMHNRLNPAMGSELVADVVEMIAECLQTDPQRPSDFGEKMREDNDMPAAGPAHSSSDVPITSRSSREYPHFREFLLYARGSCEFRCTTAGALWRLMKNL